MLRKWLLGSADSNAFRVRRRCIRRHAGDGRSATFDWSPYCYHHDPDHVASAFLVFGGLVVPSNSNTAAVDDIADD